LEFIDALLADNKYLLPVAEHVEGGVHGQIQHRKSRKLKTKSQRPLYFLVEAMSRLIYFKFYHRANNHSKSADGFYNSMIDKKHGHLPSPLIMFSCTTLRHTLLEWEKNKGVHPKASKSS